MLTKYDFVAIKSKDEENKKNLGKLVIFVLKI